MIHYLTATPSERSRNGNVYRSYSGLNWCSFCQLHGRPCAISYSTLAPSVSACKKGSAIASSSSRSTR